MTIRFDTPIPDSELFNEKAHQKAKLFSQAIRMNKPSQIRRFYDELVNLQERIGISDDKFKELEAFVRMLNAKIAYAQGRGLVDDAFATWFSECLKTVNTSKSLGYFRLHFEAVLGFLKAIDATSKN